MSNRIKNIGDHRTKAHANSKRYKDFAEEKGHGKKATARQIAYRQSLYKEHIAEQKRLRQEVIDG